MKKLKLRIASNFIKLLLLLFFAACDDTKEKIRPPIPEEKMVQIMTDIHIFEAMMENSPQNDSLALAAKDYYDGVFSKHEISKNDFLRAFDFYEKNPQRMDELLSEVISELSKMEAELKGKLSAGDSIANEPK